MIVSTLTKVELTGFLHFVVQVVTLTGTFTDTSKYGVTTMCLCDVVNQLLNKHSLSDASTSEETDLPSTSVRCEQIDDCGEIKKLDESFSAKTADSYP